MSALSFGKEEVQALLNQTPNTPENQSLIGMLLQLLEAKKIVKAPFTYAISFAALAPTATVPGNINIQADAAFLIMSQTYTADVAAAGQTISTQTYPLVNVLLTDTGKGVQLMNQAVPVPQLFGNGQFPFILPEPYLMQANSNLGVTVTNRDAAQTYNLTLSFEGVKLFAYG